MAKHSKCETSYNFTNQDLSQALDELAINNVPSEVLKYVQVN